MALTLTLAQTLDLVAAGHAVETLTRVVALITARARPPAWAELEAFADLELVARVAIDQVNHWQATIELAEDVRDLRCLLAGAMRPVEPV